MDDKLREGLAHLIEQLPRYAFDQQGTIYGPVDPDIGTFVRQEDIAALLRTPPAADEVAAIIATRDFYERSYHAKCDEVALLVQRLNDGIKKAPGELLNAAGIMQFDRAEKAESELAAIRITPPAAPASGLFLTDAQVEQVMNALEGWEGISPEEDEARRKAAFEMVQDLGDPPVAAPLAAPDGK